MSEVHGGGHIVTEEEVIMETNSNIVRALSEALGNVEADREKEIWIILDQIRKHADLVLKCSEKLIQSQRVDIRSIK